MAIEGGDNGGGAAAPAGGGGAAAPAGGAVDLLGGAAPAAAAAAPAGDAGAAPGGEGGGSGVPGAGGDPDWYGSLSSNADGDSASNLDWIKAKGFKDIDGMAKSLRFAEKAIHDSGRIKLPGEGAPADEVAAYHRAIGVPDAPTGYEFAAPTGANGEPMPLNTAMLERIAAVGHKLGIPKAALEGVAQEVMAAELDDVAAHDRVQQAAADAWVKAQGQEAAAKIAAIDKAAGILGLSRDDMVGLRNVLGSDKALTLMARLGDGLAEGGIIDPGGRQRFTVSAAEAKSELDRLKADPAWVKKAFVKGTPEAARYDRLNDILGQAAEAAALA